jgi:hypothetical protein
MDDSSPDSWSLDVSVMYGFQRTVGLTVSKPDLLFLSSR